MALERARHGNAKAVQSSRLELIGGCRNAGDEARVQTLTQLAEDLGVSRQVAFRLNVTRTELKEALGRAAAGLHTMYEEHFGIGVVEYMAAGCIPLANNSGGPAADIVKVGENAQCTGYLASTVDEYASAIVNVLSIAASDREKMAVGARKAAAAFSDEAFEAAFLSALSKLLDEVA